MRCFISKHLVEIRSSGLEETRPYLVPVGLLLDTGRVGKAGEDEEAVQTHLAEKG